MKEEQTKEGLRQALIGHELTIDPQLEQQIRAYKSQNPKGLDGNEYMDLLLKNFSNTMSPAEEDRLDFLDHLAFREIPNLLKKINEFADMINRTCKK